jgi:Asp-tRNA(Asn)/Glu-tRNA(Gln) amidotransferase A subunit family amidase
MVQQNAGAWPNTFRVAQFVPAVDYINANRARALLMQQWWDLFKELDVIVATTNSGQLGQTNLTGNPAVIVPHGFREAPPLGGGGGGGGAPPGAARPDTTRPPADTTARDPRPQTPVSLTFLGPLFQDENALVLAHHYQKATDFHLKQPPGFKV